MIFLEVGMIGTGRESATSVVDSHVIRLKGNGPILYCGCRDCGIHRCSNQTPNKSAAAATSAVVNDSFLMCPKRFSRGRIDKSIFGTNRNIRG
jgi:hypothetical protein